MPGVGKTPRLGREAARPSRFEAAANAAVRDLMTHLTVGSGHNVSAVHERVDMETFEREKSRDQRVAGRVN
jgi:hypothetical protein